MDIIDMARPWPPNGAEGARFFNFGIEISRLDNRFLNELRLDSLTGECSGDGVKDRAFAHSNGENVLSDAKPSDVAGRDEDEESETRFELPLKRGMPPC